MSAPPDAFPVRLYRPSKGRLGVLTGARVLDRAAFGPAGVLMTPTGGRSEDARGWSWPERRSQIVAAGLRHAGLERTAGALLEVTGTQRRDVGPFDLGTYSGVAEGRDFTDPVLAAAFDDARAVLGRALPAGRRLRPFQAAGVTFARASGYRLLFGDAPGLGKTAQALACIALEGAALLPAVVVAPSSAFGNWRKEAAMWVPAVPVHSIGTREAEIPAGFRGLLITTWGLLADHADAIARWGPTFVIADEAHYAKNPEAQRHQALAALTSRAPYCALLTGTPLKNRRDDLATLIDLIDDAPDRPTDPRAALRTWSPEPAEPTDPDGEIDKEAAERLAESSLMVRVRGRMVRRLKMQVLSELPAKVRVDRDVVLPADVRGEYDLANQEFEEWLGTEYERRLKEEGATTAEARAEAEDRVARAMKSAAMVKIGYLRAIAAKGKIDAALSVVTDLLRRREPVVVFADHLAVIEALSKRLTSARVKHAKIIGATSKDARDAAIEGFQKATKTKRTEIEDAEDAEAARFQAGAIDVLLCSSAAKEAITLHRSCNVVFVERYWTPADEEQAEDRVHRIGQHRPVTITRLRAVDTVDVRIGEILDAKADLVARTIGAANVDQKEGEMLADISASFVLDRLRERRGGARQNIVPRRAKADAAARPRYRMVRGDVQAFVFPSADWTPEAAIRWLKMSRFPTDDTNTTAKGLRADIRPARQFARGSFQAVRLDGGVIAIVGRRLRT